jgi:class 3 adenylate cyclase/tetratricopeptide (TPR) repeat protein/transcriptional regulator with XRE-family HTH domain
MGDSSSFGDWIRRRRRALDLTREALAGQVGCAVVTIRKIETDERRPSRQIAARLAECLLIPEQERAAFLQAARAELAVDRLTLPPLHTGTSPAGYAIAAEFSLSQSATLPTTVAPPPQLVPPSSTCPACGAAVPADQQFCGQCGTPTSQICSVCRVENPGANRFCSGCGATLKSAPPQSTALVTERAVAVPREERRWATVLFADLSGYTLMSERMDPEDVQVLVARCIEQIGEQIRRFGGTVVNVMGDAVLAVFGAPLAHEDDAARAVRAAIALRDSPLSDDPLYPLTLHVGINTGEVLATVHGPQEHRDYTVLGDTVNTAERILKAAPSGSVLVGEETYRATRHVVQYHELAPVVAQGKERLVPIWEALTVAMIPAARPLGVAPLIGRDEELDRLLRMWTRVTRDTQPHLVTVLGEPGIGKSRLVAEFEQRLPDDVTIWHGRCLPYGEALGYWALAMVLKEAAGIMAEDDAEMARAKLGILVAGMLGTEGDPLEMAQHLALLSGLDVEADRLTSGGDQRILHASMRRFLEACARQRPLCLIFDDLHWADEALLDLIESVAARVREAPLLIVTQARPELLEKRATWGRGVRSFTSLLLESLSESSEHNMIRALCQEHGLPVELVAQVGHRPGGNPLFVEELVAMIAEGGPAAGVPSAIKMLIAARLDSLPPEERTAIQLAAIFGKVFWAGGLRALDGRVAGNIANPLEALEQKDLLRALARSQFRGDHEYIFKHDLIRDVAYEMLPKVERRALHSRAADWLERAAGEQVENYFDQLAHHAVQARRPERAVGYLMRAAERAGRAAAHRQAAVLLGQAITIAERLGRSALLADLRVRRGKAFGNVGMWAEARPELEAALAELPKENLEQRALVLIDLAHICFWLADMPNLRRYSSEAKTLAEAVDRADIVAGAIAVLAQAYSSDGELQSVVNLAEQALLRAGDKPLAAVSVGAGIRALTYYWLGRFDEAVASAQQSTQIAHKTADTQFIVYALPHHGLALAAKGNYAEAEQIFGEAQRIGREYEIWTMLARTMVMSAGYHYDVFDFAGQVTTVEEARDLALSVNFLPPIVSANLDLLFNYIRRQDVGRAEQIVNEVAETVEQAAGTHGWLWRLRLAQARAELALARGDAEETLRLVEHAIAQSQARGRVKYHAFGLETRARALNVLGRKHAAIAEARQAVNLIRPIESPALFLRAAVALIELDGDDALLEEARAAAQRIVAALPNDELIRRFEAADPVRLLGRRGVEPLRR